MAAAAQNYSDQFWNSAPIHSFAGVVSGAGGVLSRYIDFAIEYVEKN